jgi:hypothetical protein
MANDVSANPMFLDTPLAYAPPTSLTPVVVNPTVIFPSNVKVNHFEYVGYAAQGNLAIVKDRNGKLVSKMTGAADLEEVRTSKVGWISGLCLDTCQGGGAVLVYLD